MRNFHAVMARLTPLWLRPARNATSVDGGSSCVFCAARLRPSKYRICPKCNSRPRIRSIYFLLQQAIVTNLKPNPATMPCLAFGAVEEERALLRAIFPKVESVSLFGKYGKPHSSGVDARALTDIPDAGYAAHYSCTLFDYFSEHENALAEAYRVLAPGGVFLTHIQDTRLTETRRPPRTISVIEPRPGYYGYIPAGRKMADIRVGALWFLEAISRLGMKPSRYRIIDGSRIPCDWFVGWKS